MFWRINKTDTMPGVLQEFSTGGHIEQNTGLAFLAQRCFYATEFCHTFHQGGGFVGVELVCNEHPFCLRVGRHGSMDMGNKVLFCPRVAESGVDDFTGSHFKVGDQCLRSMPGVFELMQFQLAFGHRMVRVYPLQCLDSGFFVNTDDMHARFVQLLCLVIEFAHGSDVLPESGFILHFVVQPVFDPVGF